LFFLETKKGHLHEVPTTNMHFMVSEPQVQKKPGIDLSSLGCEKRIGCFARVIQQDTSSFPFRFRTIQFLNQKRESSLKTHIK
jgi:hypothetical protein